MQIALGNFPQNRNRDSAKLIAFPVLALSCFEEHCETARRLGIGGSSELALQI